MGPSAANQMILFNNKFSAQARFKIVYRMPKFPEVNAIADQNSDF